MKRFSALALLAASDLAVGFAVQSFVLVSVGIGSLTDAFFAGQALPLVLLSIIQLPLQRASLSAFSGVTGERYPALKLFSGVFIVLLVLTTLLSVIAPWGVSLIYSSLPPDAQAAAVGVLRIQGLAATFSASNLVMLSLNHLSSRFLYCEMSLLFSGLVGAAVVVATVKYFGVMAAAYGQLVKAMLCGVLYLIPLRGKLSWATPPWDEVKKIVAPLASAGALTKFGPVIDRSIASGAASGSLTVLAFTQWIFTAGIGVAERALIAPRLPGLKKGGLTPATARTATQLAVAGALSALALFLFATAAGSFGGIERRVLPSDTALLAQCAILLIGFPIGSLSVQWMAAAITVYGRPDVTAKIVAWGFFVGVSLKVAGFWLGGIQGLAIGISIYYLLNAAAFVVALKRLSTPAASSGAAS